MPSLLLFGASGAIGGAVAKRFTNEGYSVVRVGRVLPKNCVSNYFEWSGNETRKVVYKSTQDTKFDYEKALLKGVEFELLWLKSKQRYYSRIKHEDANRIPMLEKRLSDV